MAVVLTRSYNVNSASNTQNQTITISSFKPTTGEIIVVKAITQDQQTGFNGSPTATGGGITWTLCAENNNVGNVHAAIWTGTVTAGGSFITVSITSLGSIPAYVSMVLERWSGAQLSSTPSTVYANGLGMPTATLTVVGTGSVVTYLSGDWSAVAGTATYTGGATQDGTHVVAGAYSAYYSYQTVSAGLVTLGMTAPTGQTYSVLAIEIQVSGQVNPGPTVMMTTGVGS